MKPEAQQKIFEILLERDDINLDIEDYDDIDIKNSSAKFVLDGIHYKCEWNREWGIETDTIEVDDKWGLNGSVPLAE